MTAKRRTGTERALRRYDATWQDRPLRDKLAGAPMVSRFLFPFYFSGPALLAQLLRCSPPHATSRDKGANTNVCSARWGASGSCWPASQRETAKQGGRPAGRRLDEWGQPSAAAWAAVPSMSVSTTAARPLLCRCHSQSCRNVVDGEISAYSSGRDAKTRTARFARESVLPCPALLASHRNGARGAAQHR